MKKNFKFIAFIVSSTMLYSCSFFNHKEAQFKVSSNPSGARIVINGQDFGRTPAIVSIPANEYNVILDKEGFGSANFKTDFWTAIKTDGNDKAYGDSYRCFLDALNPFLVFTIFTKNCKDFKTKSYNINITQGVLGNYNGNYQQNYGYDANQRLGNNYNPNQYYPVNGY